jgi:ubiquitin carboxyl-terminal hydrolase 5/13
VVRDEPPQKMSKLSIAAETESDRYDIKLKVRCFECKIEDVDQTSEQLSLLIDAVMKANTFSRQEEVKAWEQEIRSCEHILTLTQEPEKQIQSQDLGHCSMCDLQENLWLCLQCGNLGCGRAQFGGVGGNSHGLQHANSSNHAVAVKLGSITPDGTADIYCYHCDDERVDDDIGRHLANWGILLAERQKTEKSLTEMQIEQNLRWEFSMTTEDGRELRPLFGKGFTGLRNLGNSCYLASSLQCLFALPQFRNRYYLPERELPLVLDPAQDLETQLRKLADGLLSGRYSYPDSDLITSERTDEITHQKGISPSMLKHLIGKGHSEFSTMRQQDAYEILLHLFKLISRSQHIMPLCDPTKSFRFSMEQRLQCLACKRVRYSIVEQDNISIPVPIQKLSQQSPTSKDEEKGYVDEYQPVTLKECFDSFTSEETVELTCAGCESKNGFLKRSLFKTFPEVLVVNARRFVPVNWVPTKVDVPVVVNDEPFLLDDYKSSGLQPSEELLPDEPSKLSFMANPEALRSLMQMGFPQNRCEKALHATGNSDADAAMDWLLGHMEDPNIDAPIGIDENALVLIDAGKVESLGQMGFKPPQARKALKETGGNLERAIDWLFNHPDEEDEFAENKDVTVDTSHREGSGKISLPGTFRLQSIICHKGASIHAG